MIRYCTKIRIKYTNLSANCATGVYNHDLSKITPASRGSDCHRRWGGRSQRSPIRICTRLLHGRAHATQFLRAGDLPPTSTVLSTCALPCPDGLHVERENVGRWCRPITPALQYRKSWICLKHFSCFFEWELDSRRKVLETNICKHHKGTCLEQKS